MQSANTVESGGNPTGSESSQTTSLSETKEESGAAKKSESGAAEKSEKESNSGSSQQNSVVPTVPSVPSVVPSLQESSTEELLKILEEGNLSEVSTVFRTSTFNPKAQFLELQPKGLNLTPRQVYLHFNPKV